MEFNNKVERSKLGVNESVIVSSENGNFSMGTFLLLTPDSMAQGNFFV